MKIIFAGTPEFAVPTLSALLADNHHISLVLTQPDRPSGRGMRLKASPVKQFARQHNLTVLQPETLKDATVQSRIAMEEADAMVVAAYGLIIPDAVLQMPHYGCFNVHASLLPRWRGAAPIQRAMLAGDTEAGVTIMEVVSALDAGAMIARDSLPIGDSDTAQTLRDGLSDIGAKLMLQAMNRLQADGKLSATPQDESLVTYAHKLDKAESRIDWQKTAAELSRQVRAFNPFPVAHCVMQKGLDALIYRIWRASAVSGEARPGQIVDVSDGITVGCGQGLLKIEELQISGGKRLLATDFLAGHAIKAGDCFEVQPTGT